MTSDEFFEHLQEQYLKKLPLVAYRKPNTSVIKGILQNDEQLHTVTDYTENGFVFAPFDARHKAILFPSDQTQIIESDFEIDEGIETHENLKSEGSGKENHENMVKKAISEIALTPLEKVVLSRCETLTSSCYDPLVLFKNLLNTYPTAFVYLWYHEEVGLWLGATPETLLGIRGSVLNTMALAGTQPYKGTIDVIWKDKEKEEQQIVTDFIVANLRAATQRTNSSEELKIAVSDQKTVRAGNLLHLQTEIAMRLNLDITPLQKILELVHPTPAVCGYPKQQALDFIFENEGYPREFYAGFLGELNNTETTHRNPNRRNVENNAYHTSKKVSHLYVNLRCMQIKNNNILIYVGGGITKDSDPEKEWEETVHKSKVIKKIL